jgi:hypothetical protein
MTIATPRTRRRARRSIAAAAAILGFAALAACSGGKTNKSAGQTALSAPSSSAASGSTSASTASTQPPTTAKGVNPNAKEVNEAGDIPDNQVFVDYTPPSGRFTVTVPEGWARSESDRTVTFTDKLNSVRLETVATPTAPTLASVTNSDLPPIRAASSHFEAGTVKVVTRRGGSAVLATYRADAPPNPVTGKVVHDDVERYAFWQNGTALIITLSCPQGADNVDPWRIITDSFQWR